MSFKLQIYLNDTYDESNRQNKTLNSYQHQLTTIQQQVDELARVHREMKEEIKMEQNNEKQAEPRRHSFVTVAENTVLQKASVNLISVNVCEQRAVILVHNRSDKDIEFRKDAQIGKIHIVAMSQTELKPCSDRITREIVNVDATLKIYKNPGEEDSEEQSMEEDTESEEKTTEEENEEYNRPRRKTKKPLYLRDYFETSK
ncbi:hypothetical protein CBL_20882 [Carabus blaptoides fortunei]